MENRIPEQSNEADALVRRGQMVYEQRLKALLELENKGKVLAIEPDSGRYFMGVDRSKVALEALAAMPGKRFFFMRIGFPAMDKLGDVV